MDLEHLPRFAVADMDAARPLAVLTIPSGCRSAACAGAANPFGGDEWEAHFGASTIAFSDEAFHEWLLEQVCEGCAPPV